MQTCHVTKPGDYKIKISRSANLKLGRKAYSAGILFLVSFAVITCYWLNLNDFSIYVN